VLTYLNSLSAQSRETIASILYPILTRIYFSPFAMFLSEINGDLLSVVSTLFKQIYAFYLEIHRSKAYQLLVTTIEPQARNAVRLRDHGIISR
jgi:hypothetical protein